MPELSQKNLEDLQAGIEKINAAAEKVVSLDTKMNEITETQNQLKEKFGDEYEALAKRLEGLEISGDPEGGAGVELGASKSDIEKFSVAKLFQAMLQKDWEAAPFEHEVIKEARKKTLQSPTSGSGGGYLIPQEFIQDIIELLREELFLTAVNATFLTNLSGSPVRMPRQTSKSTAAWTAEGTAITDSDPDFDEIQLTPHGLKALVKMSNRFDLLAFPDAEAMLRADIARTLSESLQTAVLSGSGSGEEPAGLDNVLTGSQVIALGTNGGRLTFDEMEQMESVIADANALRGSLHYVMHNRLLSNLKREKHFGYSSAAEVDGAFRMGVPMSKQMVSDAVGYGIQTVNSIPINITKGSISTASRAYFGNWIECIIGMWGGLNFAVTSEAGDSFEKDQTWIRAVLEADVDFRHFDSFVTINDADSARLKQGS